MNTLCSFLACATQSEDRVMFRKAGASVHSDSSTSPRLPGEEEIKEEEEEEEEDEDRVDVVGLDPIEPSDTGIHLRYRVTHKR